MKTINKTKLACALGVIGIIVLFLTSCIVTEEFMNELLYGTGDASGGSSETAPTREEINASDGFSGDISGTYFSENWGEIVFIQNNNKVSGTFSNGVIEGTLTGDILEGTWAGPWVGGRVRLKFSSDTSSFKGYEAYGNLEPEANNPDARPWSGTRIGSLPAQETKTQKLVSPPIAEKSTAATVSSTGSSSAFNATGVYRTSLGELTLSQNGSTVTGSYPQSTLAGQMSGYELTGQIFSLGTTADIRFTFASDGSGFQGEMLYQGESHVWNGTKISGGSPPQQGVTNKQPVVESKQTTPLSVSGTYYSENWGEIVLEQRGEYVTGTYPNGILAGTLTGNTLEGTWESPWTRGRMILKFSTDAKNFSGYENIGSLEPKASNPDSSPWTGVRIGSSPQGNSDTGTTQVDTDQFDLYYGGWIDVNEDNSGFVFGADTSLILFFDGEIAEGYWTTKGKNITLFVEGPQGDYVTFEGTYDSNGTNLLLTLDGDQLVLERHWISNKDDVIAFNNHLKTETTVQSGSITGVYDTNFGKMTLTQRGSSVTGEYPMGEVQGNFSNNTFSGTFSSMGIEGTFNLVFTPNGDAFEGKMVVDKYTDYLWIGTRISLGVQDPPAQTEPIQSSPSSYSVGMKGPAGGIIFYDKGEPSDGWRYLEVAPQGAEMTKMWAPNNEMTASVFDVDDEIGRGEDYTGKIVRTYANTTSGSSMNDYAAQACESLSYGGFNDWFLPSHAELVEIYNKVHKEGLGGFARDLYWSSTEWKDGSNSYAYYLNFDDGSQYVSSKMDSLKVRPVRAF